ncbi:MAG TPA: alpha/beta fold hydrolase, partial [Herpetosiphonaceae bacterium]
RRGYAGLWPRFVADFARVRRDPAYALLLDDLFPNAGRLDLEQFATYCQRMPELDITARLAAISAPALILAGADDPLVDCGQSRRIAGLMPNATLAVIANAGHFVALEQPDAYRDVLAAWLDCQKSAACPPDPGAGNGAG